MKITLIHGEDTLNSRKRFVEIVSAIKDRGWEVVSVKLSQKLKDQLSANSLFSDNILFTLEEGVEKLTNQDLDWLNKNYKDLEANFLIFSSKELGKLITNKLPKEVRFEKFDLPKELFRLLEEIYPKNMSKALPMLNRVQKTQPVELIFALLVKQLRDLYWLEKDSASSGIPSWRENKLKYQLKKYSNGQLANLINKLADLDIRAKTSQANLGSELDFLLISNLQ